MKTPQALRALSAVAALLGLASLLSCATSSKEVSAPPPHKSSGTELAQVPTWSQSDLNFFLHGSMSTEFVPETVLHAFMRTYPDLFPTQDFSHLGLIPDPAFGWPVGISRSKVPHLGGLSAVGVNCAACHVGEITSGAGAKPVRVLGMTSHFDAEAFFGAVIVSTFRTSDPANMKKFLAAYLTMNDPKSSDKTQESFAKE